LTRERISFKEKKDTTKLHTQANKVEDLCTFHQPLTMSTVPGLEKAMGYWRRNKRPSTVKQEIETERDVLLENKISELLGISGATRCPPGAFLSKFLSVSTILSAL